MHKVRLNPTVPQVQLWNTADLDDLHAPPSDHVFARRGSDSPLAPGRGVPKRQHVRRRLLVQELPVKASHLLRPNKGDHQSAACPNSELPGRAAGDALHPGESHGLPPLGVREREHQLTTHRTQRPHAVDARRCQ